MLHKIHGPALPHQGMQERLKRMMKDKEQWLWMVQHYDLEPILSDTGIIVATAEKHRHEFTRRLTKKEVIAHITKVWQKEQNKAKLTQQTSELTNSVKGLGPK